MKAVRRALLGALILSVFAERSSATTIEQLSIVANGEKIGSITAKSEGRRVSIDFLVDNNGRGPKHHGDIVLGPDGIPVKIIIKGTSLMGGPVNESFAWAGGQARWKSQADEGQVAAARPSIYVVNDDNPYMTGIYARAALADPDHIISVVPRGSLTVTKLREETVAEGGRAVRVSVYRLAGIQLAPSYLMLDRQNRLFATFSGGDVGTAIREGYEASVPQLERLGRELETVRMDELQRKLAHRYATPVRITNVRIFDPREGGLSGLSSVVMTRDTITRIVPNDSETPPADETVIDGEGGTVFPGLHDMHSHATLDAGLMYLAAGVTSTRDMGNDNAFMLDLLPKIEAGQVAWPRIVPSGFLEGRSPYSARYGFIPETLDDAKRDVLWYADHGYAEIKIYNSFNPDWVKPVADEAHRLGLRVSGHVPAFDTPDRVVQDGYNAIAHVNQLMLGWILDPREDTRTPLRLTAMARAGALDLRSDRVQRTVTLMKQKNTALDTTAVTLEMLMLSRAGEVPTFARDYIDHMPIGYQRYRRRTYVTLDSPMDDQAYRAGFAKVLETIHMMHKSGIRLLPGTDDGTGFTVQRELELYVQAGLTAAEALRAGTLGAEEYFGRDGRLGTIERGKLADFVLVAGDPTRDITAIKRPRMVVKDGTVYFPSEIYTALNIQPFTTIPTVRQGNAGPVPVGTGGADGGFGYALEGE